MRHFASIIAVVLGCYLLYLFNLQVLHGTLYAARAREFTERLITIPALRGKIYDRNMRVLATNRNSYDIDLIPAEAAKYGITQVLHNLAKLLKIPVTTLWARLPTGWRGRYEPIVLDRYVPFSTITYIAEHVASFPGISWQSAPIRYYPVTGAITHVVGYVGDITQRELQVLYNKGYTSNSIVGKDGVEEEYDSLLQGKPGRELEVVDANGRPIPGTRRVVVTPVNGKDLVLTINSRWEKLAEQALGPRTGSVIILRPSTGAILAMVSYPWYDPNRFEGKRAVAAFHKVLLDPRFPFINRAIQSAYAPASTFKIIETAADYYRRWLPPKEKIDTTGSMVYGGRVWHDWNPHGFGWIGLKLGFANSSDQYFWTLSEYMGINNIVKYAKMFGLGQKTGIDLPGEVTGLVPSPAWKKRTYGQKWLGGDTFDMAIGQGFMQVTPIQMADVVAMVVNKGVVYKPHVLKEVLDPVTGRVISRYHPQVLRRAPLPKWVFTDVQKAMRANATVGTAAVVITEKAVKIASKTGTGQTGVHHHWSSWFASFAPYGSKNPNKQIVMVVMVGPKNHWQWWGPKASDIIYQGIYAHQSFWQAVHALEPAWYLNKYVVGPFDNFSN